MATVVAPQPSQPLNSSTPPLTTPRRRSDYQLKLVGREVAGRNIKPASDSMHESSLYQREIRPELQVLDTVQRSLRRDREMQMKKYGTLEPSPNTSRYHIPMPEGPQNEKYCWLNSSSRTGTPASLADTLPTSVVSGSTTTQRSVNSFQQDGASPPIPDRNAPSPGCRFNKATLQSWFQHIDRHGTGIISRREFVVGMRQHPELLHKLSRVTGLVAEHTSQPDASTAGEPKTRAQQQREDVARIMDILKEVDTDGSASMEWDEFVDFFRRAGLLLEYRTDQDRNVTSLCIDAELQRRTSTEGRRTSSRRSNNAGKMGSSPAPDDTL